jgi:uncharacterized protein YbbK (DUF523 family)
VEAGLGVPRPPIDIVDRRIVNQQTGEDVTARLDRAIDIHLAKDAPHGIICKARSPSCGAGSARAYAADGTEIGLTDGRFIARVRAQWPATPVCEARHLTVEFLRTVWQRAGANPRVLLDFLAHIAPQ